MRLSVITAILLSASCHADEEAIGSFHPDGGCFLSSAFYIWANRCGNTGLASQSAYLRHDTKCRLYNDWECRNFAKQIDAPKGCHRLEHWGKPRSVFCEAPNQE